MSDNRPVVTSNSVILHTAAVLLLPLQLLFSVFLLLRGHNEPGGGFIAGLVAASAFILYLFAHGVASTRKIIRVDPQDLLAMGLLLGVLSSLPALFFGQPFFTAQWWSFYLGAETQIKLSTVLLFDLGVYFSVLGTILTIVISLNEAEE